MMSLKSKRELLEMVRPRYLKASIVEKQKMLDEFTSATGCVNRSCRTVGDEESAGVGIVL